MRKFSRVFFRNLNNLRIDRLLQQDHNHLHRPLRCRKNSEDRNQGKQILPGTGHDITGKKDQKAEAEQKRNDRDPALLFIGIIAVTALYRMLLFLFQFCSSFQNNP